MVSFIGRKALNQIIVVQLLYFNFLFSVPPVSKLLTLATQIARLLQLPQFPEPKWSTYTARFITDLHLPGSNGRLSAVGEGRKKRASESKNKEGHSPFLSLIPIYQEPRTDYCRRGGDLVVIL